MKRCIECDMRLKANGFKGRCPKCYQRNRRYEAMPVYDLPANGEIKYAPDGKVICHICGRAFNKVLNHAFLYHNLTAEEYKAEFDLNASSGLIAESTKKKLQVAVEKHYDKVVTQNLIKKGYETRFQHGSIGRPRHKVRLQTYTVLAERFRALGKRERKKVG